MFADRFRGGPRRLAAWPRWLLTPAAHRHNRAWRREARRRIDERRLADATRLTVGVDINSLYEPVTGVGAALLGLLGAVADREDVRLRLYGQGLIDAPEALLPTVPLPAGPAIEWVRYPPPWLPGGDRFLARRLVAADRNDVHFAPNYLPPPAFGQPRRLVVHVLDLTIRHFPEDVRPDTRRALEAGLERSIRRARFVLTPCEAVRAEVLAAYSLDPARVVAVHLASPRRPEPSPDILRQPCPGLRSDEPFALAVATLEPRKNLGVLLEAFRLLRTRLPDAKLVLAGGDGWAGQALRAEVTRAQEEGWLIRPGYVSEERLAALYRRARLVAFPTRYEGFGFPALEAFAAGTPLVAADIAVLRELTAGAALLVPADDPRAWAQALETMWTDAALRERTSEAGRERLRAFDWGKTGRETVEVWKAAAAEPRGRPRPD